MPLDIVLYSNLEFNHRLVPKLYTALLPTAIL